MKYIKLLGINPSIDFVTICVSLDAASQFEVHALLTLGGFVCIRGGPGTRVFEKSSSKSYQVSTRCVFKGGHCLGTMIRIPRPTRGILTDLDQIFHGMYTISLTEFTLDILTNNHNALFSLLRQITHLKWAGKTVALSYETSFYIGDIRKSTSKGVRCYIKTLNPQTSSVRIEIVHKRAYFKKGKIESLTAMGNIQVKDAFRHIQFKELDIRRVCPDMGQLGIYKGEAGRMYRPSEDVAKIFISAAMCMLSDEYSAGYAKDVLKVFCRYANLSLIMHEFQGQFEQLTNGKTFI